MTGVTGFTLNAPVKLQTFKNKTHNIPHRTKAPTHRTLAEVPLSSSGGKTAPQAKRLQHP